MRTRFALALFSVAIPVVAFLPGSSAQADANPPHNPSVPASGALLGVSSHDVDGSGVPALESALGRRFDVNVNFFSFDSQSNDLLKGLDSYTVNDDISKGRIPMITVLPTRSQSPTVNVLPEIVAGHDDLYLQRVAEKMRAKRVPIMLRWAHEPNGNWYPWSGCSDNSGVYACKPTAGADYVKAWQHVHDLFQRVGATNVVWVWAMADHDVAYPGSVNHHWTDFYPGPTYIDWVGVDHYINDDKRSRAEAENTDFIDPDDWSMRDFLHDYRSKPIFITETMSGPHLPSEEPTTYRKKHFFDTAIANMKANPAIKGVAFFDHEIPNQHNYRLADGNPESFSAFSSMARNCYLDSRKRQSACR